ncbi:MAG: hypothetical protein JWN74_1846 [Acidobacteriaceae bacterium]|nr:hypothetical protein [Acidobacteriaceae bacterium]
MKLLCVVCVVWCSIWVHALDRSAFTFTKYDLNVRVEPEQQRLGVRGKIALRNDSASPQRSLSLQISSSLNWQSIQFEGKAVEFVSQIYTSDIDHTGALSEAIVVLSRPVPPKQTIELEIGYEGVIPQDTTRLTRIGVPDDTAKHSDWDQIGRTFTAVRGIGYVAWYPVATEAVSLTDGDSVPESVAKWKQREAQTEMKVTFAYSQTSAEAPPELLCNGTEANKTTAEAGAGQNLNTACSFASLRATLPTFVIARYSEMDSHATTIQYLLDHKSGADDYAAAAEEVSPLVSKWFGDHREPSMVKPQVVELSDPKAASFESGNMLLMPLNGSDTKLLLSAAQQLTHAFFPSPHAWIHDGLAGYAQVRLVEEKQKRQAAIAYLQAHRSALVEVEKVSGERKGANDSLISSLDDFRIQTKSMYVWWMLQDMVSEDALNAVLHNYKAANDKDKDPAYMQKLIETQAHRDLQWFFDDWVYHDRGLPDFRVESVYSSQLPSGGYMVTVTIENLGEAGAEVPVTLHMQTGEASERLLIRGRSKASVRIQAPSLPQEVTVNDGSVPESDISNNGYKIEPVTH